MQSNVYFVSLKERMVNFMTRDISSKAKPCPMCGSKRIYMDEPNYDLMFSVKIQCADCGLSGYKP